MPIIASSTTITSPSKIKKIGFLSAVALVVGSAIGAGIFFKNGSILNNTSGNISLAIGCWVIAAIGIIAMALALLDVASHTSRNKGILGWTETFTKKWFHSWSKGYITLFYYPVTLVSMPIYTVQALSDASGFHFLWWQIVLISLAIVSWLLFISILSTKLGSIANWVFTLIKFVPIFLVPIFGFIHNGESNAVDLVIPNKVASGMKSITPFFGVMASIPAIFFAFDGFYTVSSISTDLKSPKRMPWAMTIGILIITAVYLLISSGVFVSSTNGNWDKINVGVAVSKVVSWGIFVAVFGIVNGYALSSFKVYDDLIKENDFMCESKLKKFKFKLKSILFTPGFNVQAVITLFWYLIVVVISPFNTYDASGYANYGVDDSQQEDALYSLADLLTNWSTLLVFVCIAGAVFGAIMKKRRNQIAVKRKYVFYVSSIIAVLLVFSTTAYMIVEKLVDISGDNGADSKGSLFYVFILIGTIAIGFIPNLYYFLKQRQRKITK